MINLPPDFASSTLAVSGSTLTGLSPVLYTVVGVLLAIVVIVLIIGAFRHK